MEFIRAEQDFWTSLEKAFLEIDPNFEKYNGVVMMGTHAPTNIEEKLKKIQEAREYGIPFLGICFGMQLMAIEFARNVWGIKDAVSSELSFEGTMIVHKLHSLRVGIYPVLWNGKQRSESHWHNYSINEYFLPQFRKDFEISLSPIDNVIEIMKKKLHKHFIGVQFHPEYQSSKNSPHPILYNFISACRSFTVDGLNH